MNRSIHDLMNLSGRTAMITGACGKLGSIFAETLAEAGCSLILVDRDLTQLEKMREEFSKYPGKLFIFDSNLEITDERKELRNRVILESSQIDILVNNAAFVGDSKLTGWATDFENQSVETWRRALEVNLVAVFEL